MAARGAVLGHGDLLRLVLRNLDGWSLCAAACVSRTFAETVDDELWHAQCKKDKVGERPGSQKEGSRTYISWRTHWQRTRCVECSEPATQRVNLKMKAGSKLPTLCLCRPCGSLAVGAFTNKLGARATAQLPSEARLACSTHGWAATRMVGRELPAA